MAPGATGGTPLLQNSQDTARYVFVAGTCFQIKKSRRRKTSAPTLAPPPLRQGEESEDWPPLVSAGIRPSELCEEGVDLLRMADCQTLVVVERPEDHDAFPVTKTPPSSPAAFEGCGASAWRRAARQHDAQDTAARAPALLERLQELLLERPEAEAEDASSPCSAPGQRSCDGASSAHQASEAAWDEVPKLQLGEASQPSAAAGADRPGCSLNRATTFELMAPIDKATSEPDTWPAASNEEGKAPAGAASEASTVDSIDNSSGSAGPPRGEGTEAAGLEQPGRKFRGEAADEAWCHHAVEVVDALDITAVPDRPDAGDVVVLGVNCPPEFRRHFAVVTKVAEHHCTVVVLDESKRFGVGECWPCLEDVHIESCAWRLGARVVVEGLRGARTSRLNGQVGTVIAHRREGHPTFVRKPSEPDRPQLTLCVQLDDSEAVLLEPRFLVSFQEYESRMHSRLSGALEMLSPLSISPQMLGAIATADP